MEFLIIFLMTLAYVLYKLTWNEKYDEFLHNESIRYFSYESKADMNWSSRGRDYSRGIAIKTDKKTGKTRIINQTKLIGLGTI